MKSDKTENRMKFFENRMKVLETQMNEFVKNYNVVAKHVNFPNVSIVKSCCRICDHVDLYRPACNLRGDDIDLECVCSKFKLFKFYEDAGGE